MITEMLTPLLGKLGLPMLNKKESRSDPLSGKIKSSGERAGRGKERQKKQECAPIWGKERVN